MPTRYMTVKCAVPDAMVEEGGFEPELVSRSAEGDVTFAREVQRVTQQHLMDYVESVNYVTRAAYAFCRYIFLRIVGERQIQVNTLVDRKFFKQVWLSLTTVRSSGRAQAETVRHRDLIGRFKADFINLTQINLTTFRCPDQQATYSSTRIEADYLNNIELHFGNRLRQVINHILDLRAVKAAATERLRRSTASAAQIRQFIQEHITDPANRFKDTIAAGNQEALRLGEFGVFNGYRESFAFFFDSYHEGYTFANGNVFYDVKANPANHFLAFFNLARHLQSISETNVSLFQVCPLQSKNYPLYVQLDTRIICMEFFRLSLQMSRQFTNSLINKRAAWSKVFNLGAAMFQDQRYGIFSEILRFRGTIYTDGVGLSILKSNTDTTAGSTRMQANRQVDEFKFITEANTPSETELLARNCVLIDPGRRDILFCMHEGSTREVPLVCRFTKSRLNRKSYLRSARRITRQALLGAAHVRHAQDCLNVFSAKTTIPEQFNNYLDAHFTSEHARIVRDFWSNTLTPRTAQPLFRSLKLKITTKMNREYQRLANELRDFYPEGETSPPTLVIGNWSAPNARFHEPTPGITLKRKLRSLGLPVFLIDEYRSSSTCPQCQQRSVAPFMYTRNPRPHRREARPWVQCYGVLMCNTPACIESGTYIFHRDFLACQNFRHALIEVRQTGEMPQRFRRENQ